VRDLFNVAAKWVEGCPEDLAVATIMANAGFGAMSGSRYGGPAAAMSRLPSPEIFEW